MFVHGLLCTWKMGNWNSRLNNRAIFSKYWCVRKNVFKAATKSQKAKGGQIPIVSSKSKSNMGADTNRFVKKRNSKNKRRAPRHYGTMAKRHYGIKEESKQNPRRIKENSEKNQRKSREEPKKKQKRSKKIAKSEKSAKSAVLPVSLMSFLN